MLAVAVATGRLGYVFLVDQKLYGWSLSRKGAESPPEAARIVKAWIDRMRPNVVVMEKITIGWRKGEGVRALVEAIADVAANEPLFDVAVPRPHNFSNKYDEAEWLAARFPELRPRQPKHRQLWDSEPRNTTIFEALALALAVMDEGESQSEG